MQALGAKAPSQRPCKHWAPRHNNQTGSFTQTPFPFFLMMFSWRPVLALGAKKRYGCLLSPHTSTRRHQWAREHHNATIKMLSLSSCSFFRSLNIVELSNKFDGTILCIGKSGAPDSLHPLHPPQSQLPMRGPGAAPPSNDRSTTPSTISLLLRRVETVIRQL